MKRLPLLFALVATTALAAAPLFNSATESKWSVTKGGTTAGTITLLTNASGSARAEWRGTAAKAPAIVFLSTDKIWVRESGGDVELSAYKGGVESSIVPALLAKDAKAKYTSDAKGPSKVELSGYVLTRTSLSTSNADASNFAVRPKKSAGSRIARLSGDLLGSSQSSVSATAGGRGAGQKGLKLADGGNYAAVEKIENRDAAWKDNMDAALAEFQKDGKVGKGREQ